jgi:hypothetical protein
MNETPSSDVAESDSWRVQLVELNSRSRWYATQLWQVPFAYLGVTGVVITSALDKKSTFLPCIFFASAIFGVFVARHAAGITDGLRRSVTNLQHAEEKLHLPRTAEYKPEVYTDSLRITVVIATVGYLLIGVLLLAIQLFN